MKIFGIICLILYIVGFLGYQLCAFLIRKDLRKYLKEHKEEMTIKPDKSLITSFSAWVKFMVWSMLPIFNLCFTWYVIAKSEEVLKKCYKEYDEKFGIKKSS
jgi:hypothetical protein